MNFNLRRWHGQRLLLLLTVMLTVGQLFAQRRPKRTGTAARPGKSEVYLVPTTEGFDTCYTVFDAGKKWFFYNKRSEKSSDVQTEFRSAKKTSSGSVEITYVEVTLNRAGEGGAANPTRVVSPPILSATNISLDSAVNRGLATTMERKSPTVADTFEYHAHGAASLDTFNKIAPMLKYDNPNIKGRQFVKFDGVEGKVLIDRKMDVWGSKKAVGQIKRVEECLNQNPGYSVRYEVPADRVDATKNLIRRALGKDDPRLTVVARKYEKVPEP